MDLFRLLLNIDICFTGVRAAHRLRPRPDVQEPEVRRPLPGVLRRRGHLRGQEPQGQVPMQVMEKDDVLH